MKALEAGTPGGDVRPPQAVLRLNERKSCRESQIDHADDAPIQLIEQRRVSCREDTAKDGQIFQP